MTAAFLVGASHLLILYSSEARGYSLLVFFPLATYYSMRLYLKTHLLRHQLLLSVCGILGFLSQLIFLQFYAALAAWSFIRLYRRRSGPKPKVLLKWAQCHWIVGIFLVLFYYVYVRRMTYVTVPPISAWNLLIETVVAIYGAPQNPGWFALCSAFSLVVIMDGLRRSWKTDPKETVFYALIVLVFSILLIVSNPTGFLFPRYFLINIVFFLMLLSRFLVRALDRGAYGKVIFSIALLSYACANGRKTVSFYRLDRGHYLAALEYLADRNPGGVISVGCSPDFSYKMMLRFYGRYLPPNKRILYYSGPDWTKTAPEWAITHDPDIHSVPPSELTANNGNRYLFRKEFRYSEYSGTNWFVYQLQR